MTMNDLASFILEIEPLMRELVRLREENRCLRFEHEPTVPADLYELVRSTPLALNRTQDGRWKFSLDLGIYHTGGGDYDSARAAFVSALEHMRRLFAEKERELEDAYGTDED